MPNSAQLDTPMKKPHVLIILDGWGHSETSTSNAIKEAKTPVWDDLWRNAPTALISGSGLDVGLPDGQMGNSEVGHMTLGAGRTIYQDLTRISKSIADQQFQKNHVINGAVDRAVNEDKAVHILGLLSPGGVHSHEDHIIAMIDSAAERGAKKICIHAFLDGRDTPPKSAEASIRKVEQHIKRSGYSAIASIATLTGRYYAMDRDQRWERVQRAYTMMVNGRADFYADSALEGLKAAYDRNETDEFVKPTAIKQAKESAIKSGDAVIFMNFRADRARQLTRSFVDQDFKHFERGNRLDLAGFIMLTQYDATIETPCAFPPQPLKNVLAEHLSKLGKTQLRISETEKYAHVTFFFSGGREEAYPGETRLLIPSPKVATYDLQPEMSAPEVTEKLIHAITHGEYDLIVCNFANGDMVGHTGNYTAALKAAEVIDHAVDQVVQAVRQAQGECLITADHGNIEQMVDESTGQPHTAHTCEPVPLIYIGSEQTQTGKRSLKKTGGTLADVAPTLLEMMQIEPPEEMEGQSLLV